MTMLDDRTPPTVHNARAAVAQARPLCERHSFRPGRQVRSHRGPRPGNTRTARSVPVDGPEWLHLPGTPWSMRLAAGSGRRRALEIHAAGSLIDVMVASSPAGRLLRGACMMVVAKHPRAIAWGCLPTCGELPSVEFIRGRIRRRAQPEEAESVDGRFWFADADGQFSQVVVTSQERRESCRTRTVDAC